MTFLLDQGLPRSTVQELKKHSIEAVHVGDLEMAAATDREIMEKASTLNAAIITLDSDFHSILAAMQITRTSVIRIRIEGMKAPAMAKVIMDTISVAKQEIESGSAISVTEKGIRIHKLPLL